MSAKPPLVVLAAGRARRYGGVKPLAPVGPNGEAVIDLLASDALAAGFGTLVLVIGPATGPAIRYHVQHAWPSSVDVRFAVQDVPLGTVHATLAAVPHLPDGAPFAVANADDLYGEAGLAQLATHLADHGSNSLVAYRLRNAVVGDAPVTRGVCRVGDDDTLQSVDERRQVCAVGDGRFVAKDGRTPEELDGDELVSMNLWGFGADMRPVFHAAMGHRSVGGRRGAAARTGRPAARRRPPRRAVGGAVPGAPGRRPLHRGHPPRRPRPGAGRPGRPGRPRGTAGPTVGMTQWR